MKNLNFSLTSDVVLFSDYLPDGMLLHGRNGGADFRYSFQGQEADDEIKGNGNSINYTYRMHDPRIGRFFAVDPLAAQYAYNSPYAFSENRVIDGLELEGLEVTTNLEEAYWREWFDNSGIPETADQVKKIPSETINALAIAAIKSVASDKCPGVENLTEEQKEKVFATSATQTVGILLYEFATGTGKENRSFGANSAISKELSNSPNVVGDIVGDFIRQNYQAGNNPDNLQPVDVSYAFSPDHTETWVESGIKHIESTESEFFLAGWTGTAAPTYNEDGSITLTVTLTNSTSRNSLLLHVGENYNRTNDPNSVTPLGTITQTIVFEIKVSARQLEKYRKRYGYENSSSNTNSNGGGTQ